MTMICGALSSPAAVPCSPPHAGMGQTVAMPDMQRKENFNE